MSQVVKKKAPSELEDFWGSEIRVQDCYQCQKCSAGCPVAFAMDYKPNQIMQMVSLGMKERVLSCKTIWVCASCYTCSTRCPNDIDIAKVMDWLRQTAIREGVPPAEKEVALFHSTFLESHPHPWPGSRAFHDGPVQAKNGKMVR